MDEFYREQLETARALGYGDDVAALNRDHDPLHRALCKWLGVHSYSMDVADGKVLPQELVAIGNIEEAAVLAVQKLLRAHGVGVPTTSRQTS